MNNILQQQIYPLSVSEKLQLIEEIWDSITVNQEEIPLTESQLQELDRRLASYQNGENKGESWEVVKQRISKNGI